jgi:hypothetical protein
VLVVGGQREPAPAKGEVISAFDVSLANRTAIVLAALFSTRPKTTAAEVKELLDHNPSLGSLTLADVFLRPAFPVARPTAGSAG